MKIGLIDVDGHHFPNLALMRISAYHKARGDEAEWWWGFEPHYDIVYMSKIFSDDYSADISEPLNADKVVKGGTGYCISLNECGREVYDKTKDAQLPAEIERCFPDYSIYPRFKFAVSLTSRGCPRQCGFCHVSAKEGCKSVRVASVSDFWCGQKEIKVLDPNITACRDKRELMRQYRETGAYIDYTQGLDIRLINDADIADLNATKIKEVHFAWDNPQDMLADQFAEYASKTKIRPHGHFGTVYVLTNYEQCSTEEHLERALLRIYTLRDLDFDPYVMIYDKPHAAKELKMLQRWCNNKKIFRTQPDFYKYDRQKVCMGGGNR